MSSCSSTSSSSTSSLTDTDGEIKYEIKTPQKRRLKSRLHGLNRRRAQYHLKRGNAPVNQSFFSENVESNELDDIIGVATSQAVADLPVSQTIPSLDADDLLDTDCSTSTLSSSSSSSESSFVDSFLTSSDTDSVRLADHPEPQNKPRYNTPLYEGCSHTQMSLYTMMLLFVIKHSLTTQAFADLILLINSVLPSTSVTVGSVFKIKEVLQEYVGYRAADIHYFCSRCQMEIENRESACSRCDKMLPALEFHDLHLEDQIKDLFTDEQFCRMVTAGRDFADHGQLKDICDGSEYRRVVPKDKASDEIHITFVMNTDGVAVFSSSKKGNLWPVYLAINELPITLRFSRKYLLPCYLYCHAEKPNMLVYLDGLMQYFKKLAQGIHIQTYFGAAVVKGHLLAATVDLPARAMVSNMKQFNGRYGCNMCFAEGKSPDGLPMLRYYPFDQDSRPRTDSSIREDGRLAALNGDSVRGVKGASALSALQYVDMTKVFPIDWMHAVLLGVSKALMGLWLNKEHRHKEQYIGDKVALLDQRLLGIQIPDFVARKQRSLEDHSHWKATECREWLIHFSVPVLTRVLNSSILTHYALLVSAVCLLTQEVITEAEITAAEEMLSDFCFLFPSIYGENKQTMNIHLLTHLSQCVRLFGPLFTFSAFGFESMNAHLKSMVHGTGHISNQIGFAVGMTKSLPSIVQKIAIDAKDDIIKKLAARLSSKFTRDDSLFGKDAFACVGKRKELRREHEDLVIINSVCKQDGPPIYQFFRLKHKSTLIYSKAYGKDRTKNSYCVKFNRGQGDEFGIVLYYLNIGQSYYAMLAIYAHREDNLAVDSSIYGLLNKYKRGQLCHHIHRFTKVVSRDIVNLGELQMIKKCVYMEMENNIYISIPPNLYEHD